MVTSFDMCWPGDQLIKLLSGEKSGKEESSEYRQTIHLPKTALKTNRLPAEVILLFHKAVIDVADQQGGGGLAEQILKVTCNRVKGLLLRPVYGDDFQSAQADLQHLEVSAGVVSRILNF